MPKPLSSSARRRILVYVDFGLIIVAVLVAAILKYEPGMDPIHTIAPAVIVISLVLQLSFYYNNLYDLKATSNFVRLTFNLIHSSAVAAVILGAIYLLFPRLMIARGLFFVSTAFVVLFVFSWRYFYVWVLKRKGIGENLLIVGTNGLATEIANEVLARPQSGYHLLGFWTSNGRPSSVLKRVPMVSGSGQKLFEWMSKKRVNTMVVASTESQEKGSKALLSEVQQRCPEVEIRRGSEFYEEVAGRILLSALSPTDVPRLRDVRGRRLTWHFKRLMDILISVVGLGVGLPLSILTAIAIKVTSRGPILFRQDRVGQHGKTFKLLKFRSMRDGAEAESGPVWADLKDDRVTAVGRVIRKFRIDEIPQMWNVLRGQMSFVGPRPERPCFVKELDEQLPFYSCRHAIKPGITGLAQVRHYYTATMEETKGKLEYDLYYMKHMSPLYDFMLLLDTVKTIMFGSGAR
jgi:exopolysaccharide biosynthesis polyprenyl glycosylphosphotransferase